MVWFVDRGFSGIYWQAGFVAVFPLVVLRALAASLDAFNEGHWVVCFPLLVSGPNIHSCCSTCSCDSRSQSLGEVHVC